MLFTAEASAIPFTFSLSERLLNAGLLSFNAKLEDCAGFVGLPTSHHDKWLLLHGYGLRSASLTCLLCFYAKTAAVPY